MLAPSPRIVLASGSSIRLHLLENAGVEVAAQQAHINEEAIRKASELDENLSPGELATKLAQAKAERVSQQYRDQWTIGADQVLWWQNRVFGKPKTLQEAREQLNLLRGTSHELWSAVAVAINGETAWHFVEHATLVMRAFSDDFLDHYLVSHEDDVLTSVGAYKLEGRGVQLFERVEGDYFTILGLPLLPLLAFLRSRRCLPV